MKRRLGCMGLAILMAASLTAGCGSSTAQTRGSVGSEAPEQGTCKDTAQSEGTQEQVTINFQTWNPGEGAAIDEVIAAFEEKYPNIKVNHVYMPYTDHVEKLKIDLASGEGADVFGMQTGATIKEFRDFEMDLTPYAENSWGADWQSQYMDFCMELLNEDGHYYGLPLGLTYAGFTWADVNMLKEYGLEVPGSYDDLKECARVLRENGQYPLTIGVKMSGLTLIHG